MKPRQMIQVGNHQITLPEGVTVTDWALERVHWQNPRIRAFLGCIRLLEGVFESNYSLLHCSPERLLDIWAKVRQVSDLIGNRIAPLLRARSRIPALEEARQSAEISLRLLGGQVLEPLTRFPAAVEPDQLGEVRKLLCVSIGQLHAFLQDTFGELMAADPRSLHDADYFLSRRFPQDIEEAEWLHATVARLIGYVERLDQVRPTHLTAIAERMRADEQVPSRQSWENTAVLLEVLISGLTPKLKEVLALRGVRFHEMEILDRYAAEIPVYCRLLLELHDTGCSAVAAMQAALSDAAAERDPNGREQNRRDLLACHAAVSHRLVRLLVKIDKSQQDLVAFLPLWLQAIEKRRALLLRRAAEEPTGASLLS
ncbi:MAG: hypothetical protein JOZ15_08805 [Acidobacteria bacterium]|nr:hypothetical protein [Acidobacteriota bacterium]